MTKKSVSLLRGGTIVGEHDVIFASDDEVITFHTPLSNPVRKGVPGSQVSERKRTERAGYQMKLS